MRVKFITTTSNRLNAVPIFNGQIIALSDIAGYYYDMGNQRYHVGGVQQVSESVISNPSVYPGTSDTLYVVSNPTRFYIWASTKYQLIYQSEVYYATDDGYTDARTVETMIQNFMDCDLDSYTLRFCGTFGPQFVNISIHMASNKTLILDFANASFVVPDSSPVLVSISDQTTVTQSYVHIQNLTYSGCAISGSLSGRRGLTLSHCNLRSANSALGCVWVSGNSSTGSYLRVADSTFTHIESAPVIQVYSGSIVVNISNCIFYRDTGVGNAVGVQFVYPWSTVQGKVSIVNNTFTFSNPVKANRGSEIVQVQYNNIVG